MSLFSRNKHKKKLGEFRSAELSNPTKTLFANIRFASIDKPVKTLCVTSSDINEGKTAVSSNLACTIAASGKSVLLVEADMRRRCLANMLELRPREGLYSVLVGDAQLKDAVVPTVLDNLYFLDSEPGLVSPPDVIGTERFVALVESLKKSFDYIIFDTPPLGTFVDAALVAHVVDGTMLVVRQGRTKRRSVHQSLNQLRAAEANIIGLILTFSEQEQNYYYYAYYNEEGKRVVRSGGYYGEGGKESKKKHRKGKRSAAANSKKAANNLPLAPDDAESAAYFNSLEKKDIHKWKAHVTEGMPIHKTADDDDNSDFALKEMITNISGTDAVAEAMAREEAVNAIKIVKTQQVVEEPVQTQAKAEVEEKVQIETAAKVIAEAESQVEAAIQAKKEAESQAQAQVEAAEKAKVEAEEQAKAALLIAEKVKTDAESQIKAAIEAQSKAEAELEDLREAQAKAVSAAVENADVEIQVKAAFEAAAQMKAEAEEQAKAASVAVEKAKTEVQAQEKAAAEVRSKAEAERKALAEVQAQMQSLAEAQKEAQAKLDATLAAQKAAEEAQAQLQAQIQAKKEEVEKLESKKTIEEQIQVQDNLVLNTDSRQTSGVRERTVENQDEFFDSISADYYENHLIEMDYEASNDYKPRGKHVSKDADILSEDEEQTPEKTFESDSQQADASQSKKQHKSFWNRYF